MSLAGLLWRFPSLQMAWRNLGRNRVRTVLATLGIVIGVVAIASLGIAGVALQQQATSDLGSLASDVTVRSGPDSDTDGVTDDQVEAIRGVVTDAPVVPQKTNSTTLTSRDGEEAVVSVTGVTNADALYTASTGESPERLRSGALLTNETAMRLGIEPSDPVTYNDRLYRVRGLIESDGGFGGGSELVVPIAALEAEHYDEVTVVAANGEEAQTITATLETRFNTDDDEELRVTNFASIQENVGSFFDTLNLALLGIGTISLVVASVAILNVMLMSTIERRGEIGVLRAVGIRRGEVLRMILAEATLLGLIGGVVGALASLGTGLIIFELLTGDPRLVFAWASLQYLGYGFAFAVVASVLSGLYPAWKAANDLPVEALRS